jgi:hypothetical protein
MRIKTTHPHHTTDFIAFLVVSGLLKNRSISDSKIIQQNHSKRINIIAEKSEKRNGCRV